MFHAGLSVEQNRLVFPQRQVAHHRVEEHVFRAKAASGGLHHGAHYQQAETFVDLYTEARHHVVNSGIKAEHATERFTRPYTGLFFNVVVVTIEGYDGCRFVQGQTEGVGQVHLRIFVGGQHFDASLAEQPGQAGGKGGFTHPALAGDYDPKAVRLFHGRLLNAEAGALLIDNCEHTFGGGDWVLFDKEIAAEKILSPFGEDSGHCRAAEDRRGWP